MTNFNANVERNVGELHEYMVELGMLQTPERFRYFADYGAITRLSSDALRTLICNTFSGALVVDPRAVIIRGDDRTAIAQLSTGRLSTSCSVQVWGASEQALRDFVQRLKEAVEPHRVHGAIVNFHVAFNSAREGMRTYVVQELVDETLFDEAYPDVKEGVDDFIAGFLDSAESVLILQGPPGTGKTRFLRKLCGSLRAADTVQNARMALYDDEEVEEMKRPRVLYTGDEGLFRNDELFSSFITGSYRALLIEDADHLLKPRSDGNKVMRQFLTLSDGIIRDPGKKLIFSTNLPNIRDIDEALLRPGRCYDWIATRALSLDEAGRLVARLEPDVATHAQILDALAANRKREYVLAEIYRAVANAHGRVHERARRPEGFQSHQGEGSNPSTLAR